MRQVFIFMISRQGKMILHKKIHKNASGWHEYAYINAPFITLQGLFAFNNTTAWKKPSKGCIS